MSLVKKLLPVSAKYSLINTGIMKIYGIGFFFYFSATFWKTFVFLINHSTDFEMSGTNENSGHKKL